MTLLQSTEPQDDFLDGSSNQNCARVNKNFLLDHTRPGNVMIVATTPNPSAHMGCDESICTTPNPNVPVGCDESSDVVFLMLVVLVVLVIFAVSVNSLAANREH